MMQLLLFPHLERLLVGTKQSFRQEQTETTLAHTHSFAHVMCDCARGRFSPLFRRYDDNRKIVLTCGTLDALGE